MKTQNKKGFYFSLAMVSLILGFLISFAITNQQSIYSRTPQLRKRELVKVVRNLEKERESLKGELKNLRKKLTRIEKIAAKEEGVLTSYSSNLEEAKLALGLMGLEGPGIIVTIGDNSNVPPGEDPNNYIIHDYDLRVLVNALWEGGAEAIALNNQRLIFTSAIRCAGSTILVNSTRLVSPYEIKAIGDFKNLKNALETNRDASLLCQKYAPNYGLLLKIEEKKFLRIPGYSGSLNVKYAKSLEEGS